jgi:hypothetical protein
MADDFKITIKPDGSQVDLDAIRKSLDQAIDDYLAEKFECDARSMRRDYPSLFAYWGGTVALVDDVLQAVLPGCGYDRRGYYRARYPSLLRRWADTLCSIDDVVTGALACRIAPAGRHYSRCEPVSSRSSSRSEPTVSYVSSTSIDGNGVTMKVAVKDALYDYLDERFERDCRKGVWTSHRVKRRVDELLGELKLYLEEWAKKEMRREN